MRAFKESNFPFKVDIVDIQNLAESYYNGVMAERIAL